MKIVFSHLGFNGADAFIVKNGMQMQYGYIDNRRSCSPDNYEFTSCGIMGCYIREGYLTEAEIPTAEQTITEYRRQLAAQNGAPSINKQILYAG